MAALLTPQVAILAGRGYNSVPMNQRMFGFDCPGHARFMRVKHFSGGARPDFQAAHQVVSGLLGPGSREKFARIYDLADRLGASRARVDPWAIA